PLQHTLSNPGTTLKVTVAEDRLTDGASGSGTLPHVDAAASGLTPDYAPAAFRDMFWRKPGGTDSLYGTGDLAMAWTSGRDSPLWKVKGAYLPFEPPTSTTAGAFLPITAGTKWWSDATDAAIVPTPAPAGLDYTAVNIAQTQHVYDPTLSPEQFVS